MGTLRLDAEVRWNRGEERGKQSNIPIESLSWDPANRGTRSFPPGYFLDRLLSLIDVINGARQFTVRLKVPYANLYLRPYWEIETFRLNMYDGARRVHQATCNWPERHLTATREDLQEITFRIPDRSDGFINYGDD